MPKKNFEKWLLEQVEYYKPYLDINLQKIKVEKKDVTYLEISCTYPYLEPYIFYSDSAEKEWQDGHLKKDRILHELCHILTDPLYRKAMRRFIHEHDIEDERERLTDKLAMILNNLIN